MRNKFLPLSALVIAAALGVFYLAPGFNPSRRPSSPSAANSPDSKSVAPHLTLAVPNNHSPATGTTATTPPVSSSKSNVVSQTVADGKDLDSIRKWAHNELEAQRMLAENDRIYRRQLVVLKEPVATIVERNRLTGETIHQLTLQGLDGQDIQFSVTKADLEPSGLRGTFYGHVTGRPDSLVTLAYLQTRQAYTILSPVDNLYLDVEPHDPGDVIVKSIDLEKYGAGLCGTQ